MPKKAAQHGEGGAGAPEPVERSLPPTPEPEPPMMLPTGKRNPEHLRWSIRVINRLSVNVAMGKERMPVGYNLSQARDLIETEAKLCGMDPKHLMDVRTDAQVLHDANEMLLAAPPSVLTETERVIDLRMEQMERAVNLTRELLKVPDPVSILDLKKKQAWLRILEKLKKLRDWAKNPVPKISNHSWAEAFRACHVLRFMVYVGTSSLNAEASVFLIGVHHCKMSLAIYEARNSKVWYKAEWVATPLDGCMLIEPPGHGKSALCSHQVVLWMDQKPKIKGLFGHAQAEKAEQNLAYVASYFDPDTDNGKRNRSLFPGLPAVAKCNSNTFDFEDAETKVQPTLMAYGITGKISGADADFIWYDDPCDQELAEQATTRNRIFDRMNGTWRRRLRGEGGFSLTSTTLWHHDDPNNRRLVQARDGKIRLRVDRQWCGGPSDNFTPLWPEVYGRAWLKNEYAEMRSPRLWAAAFQSNPQPEELRKIKRLRYYLPGSSEHADFLASSINHLSLDPTATNREKSDRASFIYGAVGELVDTGKDTYTTTRKLRILDGHQFHANQTDGVNEICAFSETRSVHYIHAETRSGFNATAEMLEQRGLDVIRHDPKNRKKELRLSDVANMLDDSLLDKGFPGAVIEFPGMVLDDGSIGRDPESPLLWLENQILDFGVAVEDHGVDALTQLAKYLGPQLNVGMGGVTAILQEQTRTRAANPRLADAIDRLFGRNKRGGNPPTELAKWSSENV